MSKKAVQKEDLVTHMYTADPSAHVFEGKLYIYPSHDLDHSDPDNDNGDQYKMEDYHVFSMDDIDSEVVDHGEVLHMKDVPWVSKQMWAPDAAFKNGKYYLYFPARDKDGIFRIGVAESDKPYGPFKPEPNYMEGTYSIDPAVYVEGDDAWIYVGGMWGGQLEKWQTGEFKPEVPAIDSKLAPIDPDMPALKPLFAKLNPDMKTLAHPLKELTILDEDGEEMKAINVDRRFFEAPWLHKYNDTYYLSYSTGETHYLCYATSKTPEGPFTYRGRILEPVVGWTTHQSIVEFKGKWYLFYHDCTMSGGVNHKRSMRFVEIKYNEDGTIQTIKP